MKKYDEHGEAFPFLPPAILPNIPKECLQLLGPTATWQLTIAIADIDQNTSIGDIRLARRGFGRCLGSHEIIFVSLVGLLLTTSRMFAFNFYLT
jgi:hypothetical protein